MAHPLEPTICSFCGLKSFQCLSVHWFYDYLGAKGPIVVPSTGRTA
jgi:hypothetical protein